MVHLETVLFGKMYECCSAPTQLFLDAIASPSSYDGAITTQASMFLFSELQRKHMTFLFSESQWRSPTFFSFLFFSHHNAMDRCINKFWQVFVALSTSSFLLNRRESIGDLVTHNSQEVIFCERQIQRQIRFENTFQEHTVN